MFVAPRCPSTEVLGYSRVSLRDTRMPRDAITAGMHACSLSIVHPGRTWAGGAACRSRAYLESRCVRLDAEIKLAALDRPKLLGFEGAMLSRIL